MKRHTTMKRNIFLLLTASLFSMGQAVADNVLTVNEVQVPQGGQARIEIGCDFDTEFTAFELQIALPEGLSLVADEDGYPVIEKAFDTNHILTGNLLPSNGNYKITCRSMENLSMPTSGALFSVTVQAGNNVTAGSMLTGNIVSCEFTRTADSGGQELDDTDFTIYVTEYRVVLDENSTVVPAEQTNVDVRVRRTINADEWSTICLPFDMTEAQVKEAFGNDVQLGDFVGAESEFDDADNVTGITVSFNDASAIEANHPYIIKVSEPVEEFTIDGVDIVADEDEAYIEFDNGKSGSRRVVYSGFYGTYHAGTVLDEFTLFLSSNKFYYSDGSIKMKGYRAYFEFLDVLTEIEEGPHVKIFFDGDDDETGIDMVITGRRTEDDVYDLSGRRVGRQPQRGIYIVNGKKVVIK